ncbi:MAG: protein translocase subunit SecDF [Verrucomicrobia bacterium]|jgi:SecD/SecF fusion protein|nr:MAG: protein translocase subunit SecDF [Verrucomicrobiota bacterium]PYJ50743.1 MAG: protein translocase subunit SecDF [Verrucomicrobiota bacterium]PYJ99580.1 MAG: protein translocase subunit SecDF [Verrucomicrobiota bacterium]
MTPALTFFIGLVMLVLFGWYFATDQGLRKRLLALTLTVLLVVFSIVTIWPPEKKIALGLDIQGGTSFLIRLKGGDKEVNKGMLDQAVEVIRKRVDYFGASEPIISPVGNDRILVQIPGLDTAKIQEARDQLSRVAKLEFRLVYPDSGERLRAIDASKEVIPPEYRIEVYKHPAEGNEKPTEERLLVKKKADLGGDRVSGSNAYYGNEGWTVQLKFDSEGAQKFGQITEQYKGHRFAIVLDGIIQSAPVIRDAIYGGDAVITGKFGEQEARGLASVLENPLQTPVSIEEERSVSPTLGLDSIRASILAGLVGLAITLVCVAIYYKIPGLVANLALIINLILLIGALTMFRFVLTLPGIAGIILTIGLSVDANVLIYERLREEMALGKSLKVAMKTAYEKAFSSIFDANVTTLITAAILFWKASGPVKGFAISLTLGILASLFTALIVGRNFLGWFVDTGRLKRISMLHLISSQHINFLGKGFLACMCSLALLLAGAMAFYTRGDRNFGVDFRGGDLVTLSAPNKIDVGQVRGALKPIGFADASIQESAQGGKSYITVRTPLNTSDKVEKQIIQAMPNAAFKVEGSERVGALVGGELAKNSLVALGLGILGILIFVTFRFELSFAVGAIVALLHDVLITVGMFSLLGRELTLTMVGAVLTIAGYSINDTIVVYDRIREGLASGRRGTIEQIMNESINQTLSRTILTSTVTLIPILCLFFFGGAVLRDFSLAIIIGVAVGTYSSIFIASPIVLWWTRARGGGATALRREVTQKATTANPLAH